MTQHLDADKSILYFQNFGGGGAGLGLLLGPIGVAANAAMIESNTKKDAEQLRNKILIHPKEIFTHVAKQHRLSASSELVDQRPRITPYLYVTKVEDESLLLSSAFIIEQGTGVDKWIGKYMYQLPLKYTIAELSSLGEDARVQLNEAVAAGFSQLILHLRAETPERLAREPQIIFKSNFMNPRFGFEMNGGLISEDGDVVWVRTVVGVFALRKANISITERKS